MLSSGLDLSKLATKEVNKEEMLSRISTGKAVLFTGAGFSADAINLLGELPPLANDLSFRLCDLFEIEKNNDLTYVADISIKYGDKRKVLNLMSNLFSLKKSSDAADIICRIPWRRIYTTNYDNNIELACANNGLSISSVSMTDNPSDYLPDRNVCVHLNGCILGAVESDLDDKLRLSNSSYVSSDFFLNSKWRSVFYHDIESCSALVFVGYSLYDIAIQQILFNMPFIINKTYFIVRPGSSFEQCYKLGEYGGILKIGADGFADLLKSIDLEKPSVKLTRAFSKRVITDENIVLTDELTRDLFMHGIYKQSYIDGSLMKDFEVPYVFKRNIMDEVCVLLKDGENILIHSDLGNGKTIFKDQVAASLAKDGVNVWSVTDNDASTIDDLYLLCESGRHVIILDELSRYQNFLVQFSTIKPKNINLLLSDRTVNAYNAIKSLTDEGVKIRAYSVDILTEDEVDSFISILSDIGAWKEFTGRTRDKKIQLIKERYSNQLSSVLAGLLDSTDIKHRIQDLLADLMSDDHYKKTIFSIALCDVFGVVKTSGNISDISGTEVIFDFKFRNRKDFKSLYRQLDDNSFQTKSSILSLFIINNFYSDSYIVDNCLEIMGRIDRNEAPHLAELYNSLLRYNSIEKLIPRKTNAIDTYYMGLKRVCVWLVSHPHYWVQYAMCKLSVKDIITAQNHLNTAYHCAELKNNYHTENIDTQQSRLFIMEALACKINAKAAFSNFEKAHYLLSSLKNDAYKFRQVLAYKDIYENLYQSFSKGNKVIFKHCCSNMLAVAISAKDEPEVEIKSYKKSVFINKSIDVLESILLSISR